MVMQRRFGWICGMYLLLQACSNGGTANIPPQIKPHVAEFVAQARQRGIAVDTSGLTIAFVDGLRDEAGNPINGKYTHWYFPWVEDRIELDTTQYWWIGVRSSVKVAYSREKVIFHELGHCLLKRGHRFDTFRFGDQIPKSIMGVTIIPTYEMNFHHRTYYLDELFDPTTPDPCWITNTKCWD